MPDLSEASAEFGADSQVLRRVSRDARREGQRGLTPRARRGSSTLGCFPAPPEGALTRCKKTSGRGRRRSCKYWCRAETPLRVWLLANSADVVHRMALASIPTGWPRPSMAGIAYELVRNAGCWAPPEIYRSRVRILARLPGDSYAHAVRAGCWDRTP